MNPSTVNTLAIIAIAVLLILIAWGTAWKNRRIRRLEKELSRRKRMEAAKKKAAKKPRRRGLFGLFALALLLTACGARVVYIDPASAFVFPDSGTPVLVTESGEYTLSGESLPAGCYRLDGPGAGQERGTATWAGKDGCQ